VSWIGNVEAQVAREFVMAARLKGAAEFGDEAEEIKLPPRANPDRTELIVVGKNVVRRRPG
jgi:hypothetical protein